jgi:DNA polymerase
MKIESSKDFIAPPENMRKPPSDSPVFEVLNAAVKNCQNCFMYKGCNGPVPGDGKVCTLAMFVGQNPSFIGGDKTGVNFSGKSGSKFFSILEKNGLKRENVYVTNVIKCAADIKELGEEKTRIALESCFPYFLTELAMITPRIVIPLGKMATEVCSKFLWMESQGSVHIGQPTKILWFTLFPMHHPSYYLNHGHEKEMESHLNNLFDWLEVNYPLLIGIDPRKKKFKHAKT